MRFACVSGTTFALLLGETHGISVVVDHDAEVTTALGNSIAQLQVHLLHHEDSKVQSLPVANRTWAVHLRTGSVTNQSLAKRPQKHSLHHEAKKCERAQWQLVSTPTSTVEKERNGGPVPTAS